MTVKRKLEYLLHTAVFSEGSSGQLRHDRLAQKGITDRGFANDRTFMLVEVAGDELYFETLTWGGAVVDSGELRRPTRAPEPPPAQSK